MGILIQKLSGLGFYKVSWTQINVILLKTPPIKTGPVHCFSFTSPKRANQNAHGILCHLLRVNKEAALKATRVGRDTADDVTETQLASYGETAQSLT